MITVHHLEYSQSFRIVWLLEELQASGAGMEYELKLYRRNESDRMAPPEYKALSPMGTSPTITSDQGLALSESNAIIDYLLDLVEEGGTKPMLRPPASSPDRTAYLFWFHGVQGSMQPMLTVDVIFRLVAQKSPCPVHYVAEMIGSKVRAALVLPRLQRLMEMAEIQLTQGGFLAGSQLSAADITSIYPFSSIFARYPEFSKTYPNSQAWLDRMIRRPAYVAAQARVGEKGRIVFED